MWSKGTQDSNTQETRSKKQAKIELLIAIGQLPKGDSCSGKIEL